MTFAWPQLFWLLLVPAALLAGEFVRRQRAAAADHPKILHAEAGTHHLSLVTSTGGSRRARWWLCAGLVLAVCALARPQWGRIDEPVFDQAREILIAIDLSRSMLTPDVRPSRLERAKLLTQSLLEKLAGERVGLVSFAGTAFLQSPLSSDYEILREFLPALGPGFLPEGGTNYRALIDTSVAAFGTSAADRFLIILSDGEATDDDWRSQAAELKKKGIRVIGLGIGTMAGAMIPDGAGAFVKDLRGAVVLSKLEGATLQELASVTGGTYRDASTWLDLAGVLNATIEAGQKGKFLEKNTIRLVERFQWPLAFGLWCLLVSFCYEFPVRPRPRTLKLRLEAGTGPKILQGATNLAGGTHNRNITSGHIADRMPALPGVATSVSEWARRSWQQWWSALPSTRWFGNAGDRKRLGDKPLHLDEGMLLACRMRCIATLLIIVSGAWLPLSVSAAAEDGTVPLTKIVSRLSAKDDRTARDWAELARETVSWGRRIQDDQRAVPEGPVHDALSAVDLGAALNPKAADWPKLRAELEALLTQPEEKKPPQNHQQQQNQDQQKQNQQKQDQQKQDQQQQDKESQQQQEQQQQKSPENQQPNPAEKQPSAFGDMKEHEPPPPSHENQKVGGVPEKKESEKQPQDPSMALPLQKLDQLRNQDSPAELFQMMDTRAKTTPAKTGKDW